MVTSVDHPELLALYLAVKDLRGESNSQSSNNDQPPGGSDSGSDHDMDDGEGDCGDQSKGGQLKSTKENTFDKQKCTKTPQGSTSAKQQNATG